MSEHGATGRVIGGGPTLGGTAAFLAAGLGLLAVGTWLTFRPTLRQRAAEEAGGAARMLFPELTDAEKAASLEITSFDDEVATLKSFKVAKAGGVWVLPMHENYPVDAKEQLAAAATELVERPILDVVSDSPGDHETYGVIEPDPEKVKVGMTGVGQLVEIRDASGNKLARLIVGKEDKRRGAAAGEGGRTLRFVRRAGQDPVYRVELDTSKFTTKFDDWIKKDLLDLSPWDVRRLVIDDSNASYALDEARGGLVVSQDRRALIELAFDEKENTWRAVKLEGFKGNEPQPQPLAPDEELAVARINDLRTALGDLKIVDVVRKPAGLSADLKAEEKFTGDREAVASLAQRGFFPFASGEILSSNGETVVGTKAGVEYVLRFGNGTAVDSAPAAGDEAKKQAPAQTGRYLFVTARFAEDLLEKPKLEPLPEVPAVPAADAAAPADAAPAVPPAPAASAAPPDGAKGDAGAEGQQGAGGSAAAEPAAGEGAAAPPTETPPAGDGGAAAKLEQADDAEAKAQAALEERRRIEGENRRKQEQYDEAVKAARKRVVELNNRFAEWYYVVSDAEFTKIHVGRADVVQKKAPPQPAQDPAAPAE